MGLLGVAREGGVGGLGGEGGVRGGKLSLGGRRARLLVMKMLVL